MRSRAARVTLSAIALLAFGAAGYFVFTTEGRMAARRDFVRMFDLRARETATELAELRASLQAYVAEGQSASFWMPRVAALVEQTAPKIEQLRTAAYSTDARRALMEAGATVNEIGNVDRRARDYLRSGQTLMASDVVFTEGGETTAAAVKLIESARLAEHLALDLEEADLRRRQATMAAAAAGLGVLAIAVLTLAVPRTREDDGTAEAPGAPSTGSSGLMLRPEPERPAAAAAPAGPAQRTPAQTSLAAAARGTVPLLKAAAELSTDFGRATSSNDLSRLLSRVAEVMDASGLVVWVGNAQGADLRPVLSHGYSEQVLARMPAIARSADNAAAAAYRSGKLQIVLKRPGVSNGAVIAPLLGSEGCIGAFTAEIPDGSETSEGVQALATLVAAQLTGVLSASAESSADSAPVSRVASSSH